MTSLNLVMRNFNRLLEDNPSHLQSDDSFQLWNIALIVLSLGLTMDSIGSTLLVLGGTGSDKAIGHYCCRIVHQKWRFGRVSQIPGGLTTLKDSATQLVIIRHGVLVYAITDS